MIITACEFNRELERQAAGWKTSRDTARQFIEYGKKKNKVTLFGALMFYVVKRSNISAHNAFIRESTRPRTETGIHSFDIPCFVTAALWRSPPFVKRGLRKVHHGNRGIWWQEAFCEVARADITHPIMQSSKQLPSWNKTRNSQFFFGFLTCSETSHTHSYARYALSQFPEPWNSSDVIEKLLDAENKSGFVSPSWEFIFTQFTVRVIFSRRGCRSGCWARDSPARPGSAD